MTIKQVISLINIKDIPFLPQMSGTGKKEKLPIYSTNQGVCYLEEVSIWSIGSDKNIRNEIYRIIQKWKKYDPKLDSDERELNKYVAVYEILDAINEYKSVDDDIKFDTINRYVEMINKEIIDSLDFQKIREMENLKYLIKNDRVYNQMQFNVYEIQSTKEMQFSVGKKDEEECLLFGNINYHEELDIVCIKIYEDCVEIHCKIEAGECYERKLDIRKKYTLEEKIISALDCWKENFWN